MPPKENFALASLAGADGVVRTTATFRDSVSAETLQVTKWRTTPSGRAEVATAAFLCRPTTPPSLGGDTPACEAIVC
jgi:hypothetical protein